MAAPAMRPTIVKYLYTHNPFYAISAVLMLYAIRAAYEKLGSQASNCWLMTGALAAYSLVLAAIAVWIVRWGKVWEDARSIVLLLLLLFLAVSISADDLFVKAETSSTATLLLACGFLFSALVSEGVLWGAGVRLGPRYRIPYYLMLALFFVAPWFYSPGLHPQFELSLNWLLLGFPVVAAVLFLTLIPAVRGGAGYVASNGTPWPWPWFPGAAFGVIAAAVGLRSYALTMTFGLDGDIWRKVPSGLAIVFDTIWEPYFLVPLALAILVLFLEGGLVADNQRFTRRIADWALLVLGLIPWADGSVSRGFMLTLTRAVGSPLWLTVWGLLAFYAYAWIRGVPQAARSGLVTALLLVFVGRQTVDPDSFTAPQSWPLLAVGAVILAHGIRQRSSQSCGLGTAVATLGLWLALSLTPVADLRNAICANLLWAALAVIGLAFRDRLALVFRVLAAAMFPVATLLAITGESAVLLPVSLRALYVVLLALVCLLIAWMRRNLWFLYGFGGMLGVAGYAGAIGGFYRAAAIVGRDAMTAFAWSGGALLLALLISAQKARWLPRKMWPSWRNGNPAHTVVSSGGTEVTEGLSPGAP